MCIAAIALGAHPRWRLIALANRDEYHGRPSAPLARWDDGSGIIAGRDLRSGGTWLGVNPRAGRFVLVTNHRAPGFPQAGRPSRGGLVRDLLTGADPDTIAIAPYNPCNLIVVGTTKAHLLTNHPAERRIALPPGIHGLSNGPFETPWPKTRQLNAALADWLAQDAQDPAALFPALRAETPRHTPGAEPRPEPPYAPVFIQDPVYGTRCSTVVAIAHDGAGTIAERRFAPDGALTGETTLAFRAPPP